jgi:hypothetical protein
MIFVIATRFLVLVVAALLLTSANAAAAESLPTPNVYGDEASAELATDGEDLWLAISGFDGDRDFGLSVFRFLGTGWERLPQPPGEVSGSLPISLAALADTPCLGYSVGERIKPRIACFVDGGWQLATPALGHQRLFQLVAADGQLRALVGKRTRGTERYRVLLGSGSIWQQTPVVSSVPAVTRLAITQPGAAPAITFATQGQSARQYLVELRDQRWHRLQPMVSNLGAGPLIGGAVLLGSRVFFPVTEADHEPWSFSAYRGSRGSLKTKKTRLARGAGNAQGQLQLLGDQLWASWQEHKPQRAGGFKTNIYAADLGRNGQLQHRFKLWHGISIGPGSTQVVEYQNRTLALFMRGRDAERGLHAAISVLR